MRTNRRITRHVCLLSLLLGVSPSYAGIFDNTPPAATTISDESVAQIQSAFDDQRYLDASKLLDQDILISGNDSRLVYWAGELSLTRGRYEDALANFKSVSSDPKVAGPALEGEGIALTQLGRSDEAFATLKAAVAKNPTAWRAWNALGSEFDRRHDWSDAESAYGHAISSSGGAAIVLNNRGFSFLSQNRLDEGIMDFVAALQKKPELSPARNNLRMAMALKGEYDRAITGAAAADQATVLNNAGFAAILRGDYAKAKQLLTQAMKAKGSYYALAAQNLQMAENLADGQAKGEGNAGSP